MECLTWKRGEKDDAAKPWRDALTTLPPLQTRKQNVRECLKNFVVKLPSCEHADVEVLLSSHLCLSLAFFFRCLLVELSYVCSTVVVLGSFVVLFWFFSSVCVCVKCGKYLFGC